MSIMKFPFMLLLLSVGAGISMPVNAGMDCKIVDAHVVSIFPWSDGAVFINLDGSNDCGCSISTRFAFYPNDQHAKTYLAEAMTAFASNSKVTIFGNAGCTVHANTASVATIILGGGL
jgi:hypothetical protein